MTAEFKSQVSRLQLIGQAENKFIIASVDDLIVALDQHAADERIRLELLYDSLDVVVNSQPITPSVPVALSSLELTTLNARATMVTRWGWRWRVVDQVAYLMAAPRVGELTIKSEGLLTYLAQLSNMPVASSADDIGQQSRDGQKHSAGLLELSPIPQVLERLLASRSCRYAVKFGDSLSEKRMMQLLLDLGERSFPFSCAHGRPTIAVLAQIEKSGETRSPQEQEMRRRRRYLQEELKDVKAIPV